ncbi:MAG: hypothetical protein WC314_00995 [Vulcanimicrobiota bacterium]
MSDFDLSSFLAEQASSGVSQGVGGFTISHEKAARKMAEFSLPREHAWVLKLVQAGVAWGCQSIKLTQTRNDSTFHFQFSDFRQLPTNQELVSAILRADLESTKPLDAFAMGLRLVVEKSHLSFQLLIDTGETESQAIYAGLYFSELSEKERAATRRSWSKGVTVMIHHIAHTDTNRLLLNLIPIMHHGLPMVKEIENHAYTCPVPITVDGRRLDGVFRSSHFRWSGDFKPLRTAGLEVRGDLDPPFSICPGFNNQVFGVFTPRGNLGRLATPSTADAFFLLVARSERAAKGYVRQPTPPNTLYWVRDGIVVDQETLPGSNQILRLFVFANASGLRTDLSGFHLIREQARFERVERIMIRVSEALQLEYRAERDVFERPPTVARMKDEQLEALSLPAQVLTRGLRQAEGVLEEVEDPRLQLCRRFAKSIIVKSFAALQVAVQEPDNWTTGSFKFSYLDEMMQLALELTPKKEVQFET